MYYGKHKLKGIKMKISLLKICLQIFVFLFPVSLYAQDNTNIISVPIEKNIDSSWIKSLFEKGEQKVYSGDEIRLIAMACGGIGAGQVEISGDGRLCFTESVYNQMQKANNGHGLSTGYQYVNPMPAETKIENSFVLIVDDKKKYKQEFKLDGSCFDDIRFVGEYPIAHIDYRKSDKKIPLKITSEIFSPFVPLNLRNSANPVSVLKYKITNIGDKKLNVSIQGSLSNIKFPGRSQVKYY